jgi:DnaJ-class molecular chaperone
LYCEIKIDLVTALCGGSFSITHLDDRVLMVNIVPGEVNDQVLISRLSPLGLQRPSIMKVCQVTRGHLTRARYFANSK